MLPTLHWYSTPCIFSSGKELTTLNHLVSLRLFYWQLLSNVCLQNTQNLNIFLYSVITWTQRLICRSKWSDSENCTICWKSFWPAVLSWVCLMTGSSISHSKSSGFSHWCMCVCKMYFPKDGIKVDNFLSHRSCLQHYKTYPYDEEHEFKLQIKPALIGHFYQK